LEVRVLFEVLHERGIKLRLNGKPERGWSIFINQLRSLPVARAANRQQRVGAPAHTGQRRLSEPCRHSDEAVTIILCRTILSRSNR
jgi:hypothetical protein